MDDLYDHFRIVLHPSPTLVLALAAAYAGAAACLLSLELGFGIKGLMLAFLILSGFCDLWVAASTRWRRRVSQIVFHPDGDWRVISGAGEVLTGRPVAGRVVHPLAVCFSIRLASGKCLPVTVLGDMCAGDAFRRLRAWLGIHGGRGLDVAAPSRPLRKMSRRDDCLS
ncbi:MAG TPA: protein YgfX [Gammaproteobacteria bacterium]|nr:protein YgfX [Gammaproteobacteria bacterium]